MQRNDRCNKSCPVHDRAWVLRMHVQHQVLIIQTLAGSMLHGSCTAAAFRKPHQPVALPLK